MESKRDGMENEIRKDWQGEPSQRIQGSSQKVAF